MRPVERSIRLATFCEVAKRRFASPSAIRSRRWTERRNLAEFVRLLQTVFEDALQVGASDVHLEPQDSGLLIRSRIDGLMQTQTQADKRIAAAGLEVDYRPPAEFATSKEPLAHIIRSLGHPRAGRRSGREVPRDCGTAG